MHKLFCLLLLATVFNGCSDNLPEQISVTNLATPAGIGSAEPHLARGPDDRIVMSWLEPQESRTALRFSEFVNQQWQPAKTIASSDNWFVNWADFPSLTPISEKLWAAHWLVKRPGGTYSYDVAIALSKDGGQSWSKPITPHTDNTPTEHGFASLFPWRDGVGALWLDGRNMQPDDGSHGHGTGGMTLRAALINPDLTIAESHLVDDLICDCCQTDVALTTKGPVAVYRDRTAAEIRDIYVTRIVDGQWQPGVAVNHDDWEIAGCPVNGPAVAAQGAQVVVAWFTAADNVSKVRMAQSMDGGATFGDPVDVQSGQPIGRVDVEILPDGYSVVSWLQKNEGELAELSLRSISVDGKAGAIHVVAQTAAARRSGFPQMIRDNNHLVLAWTDVDDMTESTQILTARVDIASLDH